MNKLIITLLATILSTSLWADAAYSFTYQAALRDEHGNVITKDGKTQLNHVVSIRLWDHPVGGTLLWGRTFNVMTDATGLFNLEVSDEGGDLQTGNLTEAEPMYSTLEQVFLNHHAGAVYIGLFVKDSAGEIVPRQRLFSVPFASVANDVRKISGAVQVDGELKMGESGNVIVNKNGINQSSGTSTFNKLIANDTLKVGGEIFGNNGMTINGGIVKINTDVVISAGKNLTVGGAALIPVPVGGIIMWSQPNLPDAEHWAICDGTIKNNMKLPDLRDRFIVGAGGAYDLDATGGTNTLSLTVQRTRLHIDQQPDGWLNLSETEYDNRPPFYALYYIMRIK